MSFLMTLTGSLWRQVYDFPKVKARKEQFVSNLPGTTMLETMLIQLILPFSMLFDHYVQRVTAERKQMGKLFAIRDFAVDFVTVRCVPMLLVQTLLSQWLPQLYAVLALLLLLALLRLKSRDGFALRFLSRDKVQELVKSTRKRFISEYRSGVTLATCVAILAVDFTVFPRRFAKTENFGVSLMDLGVGSVVFSGALVSQAARNTGSSAAAFKDGVRSTVSERLWKMTRATAPLIILAFSRMISVWGVDYQTHVSEYGVHWNFFCTLAFVGIFVNLMDTVGVTRRGTSPQSFILLGTCISIVQQLALSFGGMFDFVMHAERVGLISANKEGICTVPGYLSIYYIGVGVGKFIFSCKARDQWKRLCLSMVAIVVVLWSLLWVVMNQTGIIWANTGAEVHYDDWIAQQQPQDMQRIWQALIPSRRILNIGYILWIITYNLTLLGCLLIIDCCTVVVTPRDQKGADTPPQPRLSVIAHSISQNQLLTFLIANLLTGAVNITVETISASDAVATAVLLLYLLITISISAAFYKKKLL